MAKVHKHHEARPEVLAKERLDAKEVESGLRAIYGDQENTDFARLEKREWSLSRFLSRLVIVLGSLSAIAWAGYFAYLKFAPSSVLDDLKLTIETIPALPSGTTTDLVITYENPKNAPLANLSIRGQVPNTFQLASATPSPQSEDSLTWNLGAVDANAKGSITLRGTWIAPVPSIQSVQFVANYRPSNFNAEFTRVASEQITIEKSVAELTITGPESLSPGEVGSFEIALRNTGSEPLPTSGLELTLPEGFFLEKSKPELDNKLPAQWNIKDLPAGGETKFNFEGSFASGAGGFTPFTTTLFFTHEDQNLVQDTKTHTVDVAAGDIRFDLSLNAKQGSVSVSPGESIRASIIVENTTNTRITNASVLMDFQAQGRMPIRWGGFNYDGGRLTPDGVVWDAATIGTLEPGEKLILSPSFPIIDSLGSADAKRVDVILHLKRGSGDLKSELYSIYIGEKASMSATISAQNVDNGKQTVTLTFNPPPEPLEDVLISLPFASGMVLEETLSVPLGTATLVSSANEWRWRIPTVAANSTPITARFVVNKVPDDWDGSVALRAINPTTLEEIAASAVVYAED